MHLCKYSNLVSRIFTYNFSLSTLQDKTWVLPAHNRPTIPLRQRTLPGRFPQPANAIRAKRLWFFMLQKSIRPDETVTIGEVIFSHLVPSLSVSHSPANHGDRVARGSGSGSGWICPCRRPKRGNIWHIG